MATENGLRDQFKKELKEELKKHRWNYREVWDSVCACGWGALDDPIASFHGHQVDMVMPIVDRYAARREHVDEADVDGGRRAIWGGSGGMP